MVGVGGLAQVVAGFCWQGEVEGRSLIEDAGRPDSASMLLDDAATDGQTEASSAECAGVRGIALLEALEDMFELVG